MTERMGLVDIAVIKGDETDYENVQFLVVTNRKYGGFTTAGGKIDPGEDHLSAAIRELEEETGLQITDDLLSYVGCFKHTWRGIPVYCHGYYCHIEDLKGQEPKQVEEGTTPFWVGRDQLLDPEAGCIAQSYYGWLMGKMGWDG